VRTKLVRCSRLTPLLLLPLLVAVAGCGKQPTVKAEQFVGTWVRQFPKEGPLPPYDEILVLRPDGSGTMTSGFEPHPERITWLFYRGKLVFTPLGETRKTEFEYHFNSPDDLVLKVDEQETVYKRADPSQPR